MAVSLTRAERHRGAAVLVAAVLLMALGAAHPATVHGAATFVVNRIGDAPDLNLANAACDVSTNSGKQCTLRAAIQEANDTPGADIINFNITSASKVIAPASPLPPITDEVTINGYSQSGAVPNSQAVGSNAVLRVVLDGVNAGSGASGLEVAGYKSVVKGLVIQRFDGNGILLSATKASVSGNFVGTNTTGTADRGNGIGILVTGDQNTIGGGTRASRNLISGNGFGVQLVGAAAFANAVAGNLIGTNKAGSAALPNDQIGVHVVDAPETRIGGSAPEQRNVISGNLASGISLQSPDNVVVGNYIGTTADGSAALGNSGSGILVVGNSNQIGGTTATTRNVISANGADGIHLSSSEGSVIQGNRIGSKADGTGDLGNGANGVFLFGADDTILGGTSGAGNVIKGNAHSGVEVFSSSPGSVISGNAILANDRHGVEVESGSLAIEGNLVQANGEAGVFVTGTASGVRIRGNQMAANGGLGIDLEANPNAAGVTSNDAKDPDTGPNGLQNFPLLQTAVRSSANVTTVTGKLNSTPGSTFRIDLFIAAVDPSGFGEGQILFISDLKDTDSNGEVTFTFVSNTPAQGTVLTATATRVSTGSTSEFSRNIAVQPGP